MNNPTDLDALRAVIEQFRDNLVEPRSIEITDVKLDQLKMFADHIIITIYGIPIKIDNTLRDDEFRVNT